MNDRRKKTQRAEDRSSNKGLTAINKKLEGSERRAIAHEAEDREREINTSKNLGLLHVRLDGFEKTVTEKVIEAITDQNKEISRTIKTHNEKHESDMQIIMPVVRAYQIAKEVEEANTKTGKKILMVTSLVTGIGAAWFIVKNIKF